MALKRFVEINVKKKNIKNFKKKKRKVKVGPSQVGVLGEL